MSFATWTRHEWTQLRLLRRVSLLLTFAVPFLLLAGAAASNRGWMPGAPLRAWDPRTVLYDAAPLVLAAVWGLVAALATGQVFAGGRSTGTEWLVLSLPVRRAVVWFARVTASLATAVVVAVLSLAFLLAVASFTTGSAPTLGWSSGATVGGFAIVLSMLGTACVAPMLRQPFQAALAGLVVGAIPIGVATWVASAFPLATTTGGLPLAPIVVVPAYPALILVSFLVSARGEPAGRGRVARALAVVAVSFAAGLVLFVGATMASARLGRQIERASLTPAPNGDRAVGFQGHFARTLTLYDTESGTPISLLARSTSHAIAWSEGGDRFAMVEDVTTLGRMTAPWLAVRRASDGAVLERVELQDEFANISALVWCGDDVVVGLRSFGVQVLRDGVLLSLEPAPRDGEQVSVVGCVADDRILVARGVSPAERSRSRRAAGDDDEEPRPETELLVVDLDGVEDPLTVPVRVDLAPWRSYGRLSRDGRYLLAQAKEIGATAIEVLDLADRSVHVLEGIDFGRWGWLADGQLVWAEDGSGDSQPSIRAWRPGEEPTSFAIDAPDATFATLNLSPDARRVVVRASHREGDSFVTDRLAILDPATGRWTEIPGSGFEGDDGWTWGWWASSSSIVLQSPDRRGRLVQVDP
jgi:hypothetical protein